MSSKLDRRETESTESTTSDDLSSSTEFENIGRDLPANVCTYNVIVTFSDAEHGRAFLKKIMTMVHAGYEVKVLNQNRKFVIITGNPEHVNRLVADDTNKIATAQSK